MRRLKKVINFPYRKYKGEYYPIIALRLQSCTKILQTEAYVDSGASVSIFLAEFASALGIEPAEGKITYIMVGDGSYIPVYLHTVSVKLGNISFPATIGFSSHLGAEFNLIGQKDFFDRFIVSFNRRAGIVSFKPH
jgi:hypothetical protein